MASRNSQSRRELSFRRMTEIHDAAKMAETSTPNRLAFLASYLAVEKTAEDFEASHLKVIQEANADFDKEDQVRAQFDKLHYAVKAKYYALTGVPRSSRPNSDSANSDPFSKVKLPKISLPQFSGDVALWPSFFALYNTSIHSNSHLTPMEKYQYLLSSLSGEALNAVKNLQFSAEHYSIAYGVLVERYQNKRKLATHYWHSLVQAKPLKVDSSNSLRQLLDTFNENVRALELMQFPTGSWGFILLNTLLDKLTPSLREKFEAEHRKSEIPTYPQLIEFLREYGRVFESMSDTTIPSVKQQGHASKFKPSISSFVTNTNSCPVCKEQHLITKCSRFLKLSPKERHSKAKQLNLCLNCLRLGHGVKNCTSTWTCRSCTLKHHTLLHFERTSDAMNAPAVVSTPSTSDSGTNAPQSNEKPSVSSMTSFSKPNSTVLLSTIQAEALDVHGKPFPVRILLDSASQSNFISENCMRRSGFGRTKRHTIVLGVNAAKAAATRGSTSFVVRARGRDDIRIPIEAIILPRISTQLPGSQIENKPWKHLEGIKLADPYYYKPGPVDILIGAEVYTSLLLDGRRVGKQGEPDAFNTIFGWVLLGSVSANTPQPLSSFLTLDSIDTTVTRFWQLEEVPDIPSWSEEDRRCEEWFAQTTRREASGRFIVSYPFAKGNLCFADSRQIAINRFRALERRFKLDAEFKINYSKFMQEYLESGHMELIHQPFPVDGTVFYLPHHGVFKLESTTTKLRVVFDASSRCPNGLSLNQTLLTGPKLQLDVMAILLRFRIGAVALTADVKQMFRQIWLDAPQCDYQRIVWRFSEEDPISDYRLKTVTFGITPSPYLAIRCLLQLTAEGENDYPLASAKLKSSLYVDDVVASVQSVEEARELQKQLQLLLESAGFELRKWASSHPAVLAGLEAEQCNRSLLSFESTEDQFLKVLGLRWYSQTDSFGFQVNPLDRECTKRTILSELARIFDPLGFLTPLTFAAKRLIQHLWTLKLDWDDKPSPDICSRWEKYKSELSALASIRIPRAIAIENVVRREIHGFGDASEQGYGAVVYIRIVTTSNVVIRLLSAKSKVAPLKSVTLPRLELCAAVLLSDLLLYIQNILRNEVVIDAIYAWSDSTIALSWIRSSPHRWETFVRNRVARIQSNTGISGWRHVRTESNPADCCSRGLFPQELVDHPIWWTGPAWLIDSAPVQETITEFDGFLENNEKCSTFVSIDSTTIIDSLLERFSSLDKIVRIFAYCLRFVKRSRSNSLPKTSSVDQVESHSALLYLVKIVQFCCFPEDIHRLKHKQSCSKTMRKLAPFLDPSGILRVGGRLTHSSMSYEAKHPALLPGKQRLTELIIERTHRTHLHPGHRTLQYLLSQNFWILGAHQAIKHCLANCYPCFRANPRTLQPPMADLPLERVRQAKPFAIAGVDYAGPFFVYNRRARGATPNKVYVCLFVCFTIKAVHLELAFSLSTESFLSALRRFIARRGRCSLLYSDCGTNFVGAHRELVSYMQAASEHEKIKWSFNPPSAPHFGGLWESGVKSMKTHLKRVVGAQILTVEEFSTILAQIEAILNSRPLCPTSSDPNDLEVLSPGHFLTLEPLVTVPYPDLEPVPMNRLDRWQLLQHMHQQFWKRWQGEYLHTLQQRPKWLNPTAPLREGALVLLKNENAPPLQWRRGRIVKLHPGRDGTSRVATVRTADGSLTRPLVKLCPLPMGNSPEGCD